MIVLDVESSGINPRTHSILSLGAIDLDEPTNQFYDECRMWDGAQIDAQATAINGIDETQATDLSKKTEAELIRAFVAWATDRPQDRTLAAQNVSFDHDFIRFACARAHVDFPFAKRTIDVHSVVWTHMSIQGEIPPLENHHSALSSSRVLEYCGLPEEQKPHNALTGALWHAEVLSRIAYTKKLLPDFVHYEIPWQTK